MIKAVKSAFNEVHVRFRNATKATWWTVTMESPIYRSPIAAFIREMLTPSDKSPYRIEQKPDVGPEIG